MMEQAPTSADTPPEEVDDSLDRMLSFSEMCQFEGVSRWTARKAIKAGTLTPGIELINGREGWPLSWMKARREKKARRASGAETAPDQPAVA